MQEAKGDLYASCVCVRGQPDWCDRPNYSWCALLHETEFPGMHRSYAGQQLLSRRPRLAVAALRHCRRAEPAFAQVPIRIASPRGVALGDNCESSDDIAHTAYRRVARRASPDSGGAVVDVQQLQEAKDDLYASCVRVCEGSPIGVTAPTTRGAPSCTPANFLGGTSPKTLSGSQKVFLLWWRHASSAVLPGRPPGRHMVHRAWRSLCRNPKVRCAPSAPENPNIRAAAGSRPAD